MTVSAFPLLSPVRAHAGVDAQSIKQAKMLAKMRRLEERGSEFCARTIRDLSDSLGSDGGFLFEGRVAKMSVLELAHTFMDPNTSKCARLHCRAAPRHAACHPPGVRMVSARMGSAWLLATRARFAVQRAIHNRRLATTSWLQQACYNPVTST